MPDHPKATRCCRHQCADFHAPDRCADVSAHFCELFRTVELDDHGVVGCTQRSSSRSCPKHAAYRHRRYRTLPRPTDSRAANHHSGRGLNTLTQLTQMRKQNFSQTVGTPRNIVTPSSLISAASIGPSPILLRGITILAPQGTRRDCPGVNVEHGRSASSHHRSEYSSHQESGWHRCAARWERWL